MRKRVCGGSFLNKERKKERIVVRGKKVKWSHWIISLLREWFPRKPCKWETRFLVKFVWWDFSAVYALPLCSWLLSHPLAPFSLVPFCFQPCRWLVIHQGILLFLMISVSQFLSPLFEPFLVYSFIFYILFYGNEVVDAVCIFLCFHMTFTSLIELS